MSHGGNLRYAYCVNAQGRTETWYNTIPRYVMFSWTFKLNKKAK